MGMFCCTEKCEEPATIAVIPEMMMDQRDLGVPAQLCVSHGNLAIYGKVPFFVCRICDRKEDAYGFPILHFHGCPQDDASGPTCDDCLTIPYRTHPDRREKDTTVSVPSTPTQPKLINIMRI